MAYKVATITLNPAYDLVGFCPNIEVGDVNLVKMAGLHAAGKGINVARVLNDLGIDVCVSGFLGKQNSEGFTQLFKKMDVDNQFKMIAGKTRINVKLTENNGEVTDLNFSGFTVHPEDWQLFSQHTIKLFNHFDMISVNGSLPEGIAPDRFAAWLKSLVHICPRVVFDSSREAFNIGLQAKPWLIKPNDKELSMWLGRDLNGVTDVVSTAKKLVAEGIKNVVVSLGSEGAVWITKNEAWVARPPVCDVVSTVGAGDSMVAGLMHGMLMKKSIKETLCLASSLAALAVSQTNVGITGKKILLNMMDRIVLTEI